MADLHPGIVFLLIAAAVPLQMILSPQVTSDVKFRLQRLTDSVFQLASHLGVSLPGSSSRTSSFMVDGDFSDAEVIQEAERQKNAFYASSTVIRERSPSVRFRVGDVIKHKIHGYRGVIIGWDLTAKAQKEWIQRVHRGNEHWSLQPNYAVLVDGRDRLVPQMAYIPQDNLELSSGRVLHYILKQHMDRYDEGSGRYIAKPWVRKVYPDD